MAEGLIKVSLAVCAAPGQVAQSDWRVARGTTAAQLIQMALESTPSCIRTQQLASAAVFGVWGRLVQADYVLQAADRLEVYRPLLVDPKVARRERFSKQGARATGLFAKKRPGAKAGY
jgi:putative ubiquitin-RnfH superfamily antitoxin RatB of RatAB toxin-antitoxin module